jgi:hypothetical protein
MSNLQRLVDSLVDRRAERKSTGVFIAHAGDAHQFYQRGFQRRLLSRKMEVDVFEHCFPYLAGASHFRSATHLPFTHKLTVSRRVWPP